MAKVKVAKPIAKKEATTTRAVKDRFLGKVASLGLSNDQLKELAAAYHADHHEKGTRATSHQAQLAEMFPEATQEFMQALENYNQVITDGNVEFKKRGSDYVGSPRVGIKVEIL